MNQTPLESLRWSDHRAALWWLGLLYRRPKVFKEALEKLPRRRALAIAGRLLLHSLPYIFVFSLAGRFVLDTLIGDPPSPEAIPRRGIPPHAPRSLYGRPPGEFG